MISKHISALFIALSAAGMLAGCTSGGEIGTGATDLIVTDVANQQDKGSGLDQGSARDVDVVDQGSTRDVEVVSDAADIAEEKATDIHGDQPQGEDVTTETGAGPGEFGDPCSEGNACKSGFCVPSDMGRVCTMMCNDTDCPDGWWCGLLQVTDMDTTHVCLRISTILCRPCTSDKDCSQGTAGILGSRCVDLGPEEGSFCGLLCTKDGDCPENYSCKDVDRAEGGSSKQCLPDADFSYTDWDGTNKKVGETCGTGACTGGTVVCNIDGSGLTCSTLSNAKDETCNGLDDDCNGQTDEGLDLSNSPCSTLGVCTSNNVKADCRDGKWVCDYSNVTDYEENKEVSCDNKDNDCDGQTDEDFSYTDWDGTNKKVGETCGTGACTGGTVVCNTDGSGATCWTLSNAKDETCNGIDDNCDGQTDDGLTPPLNSNQLGVCAGTTKTCTGAGGWVEDYSGVPNYGGFDVPDVDGIDDDCDGVDGDADTAIFVDLDKGDDANPGTMAEPKRHIQAGIDAQEAGFHVLVGNRTYSESLTLSDGVSVYGGYDATQGWVRTTARAVVHGGTTAITAHNISSTTVLDSLSVVAASATKSGASSYGLHALNASGLQLSRVDITAGNGAPGQDGVAGASGSNGSSGTAGQHGGDGTDSYGYGGFGGSGCSGNKGGNGGRGGYGNQTGYSGSPGLGPNYGAGGSGGFGRDQSLFNGCDDAGTGYSGKTGGGGANGADGPGGGSAGSLSSNYWSPSNGSDGANGTAGSGGGGGGGGGGTNCSQDDRGAGGGGGGGGGCGGTGGTGGGGGGGSFALFLVNSSPHLDHLTLTAGNGGHGGSGGAGGTGGSGGTYGGGGTGLDNGGDGGHGGHGGSGGHGGAGGGGGGGESWCIYRHNSALILDSGVSYITGSGCVGGASAGHPGATGAHGTVK